MNESDDEQHIDYSKEEDLLKQMKDPLIRQRFKKVKRDFNLDNEVHGVALSVEDLDNWFT